MLTLISPCCLKIQGSYLDIIWLGCRSCDAYNITIFSITSTGVKFAETDCMLDCVSLLTVIKLGSLGLVSSNFRGVSFYCYLAVAYL